MKIGNCAALALAAAVAGNAAGFRAGAARLDITPATPIWMGGYAARDHASEGVAAPLWAKALAIEDGKGKRLVIVTTDLIGLPRNLSDPIAARVEKEYGLERSELLLNSSHTHSGPVLRAGAALGELPPAETERIAAYSRKLSDGLVALVGAALGKLEPAELSFGEGEAGFAMNRREPTPQGIRIGVNPKGPRDTAVPVVRVSAADGRLLAVVFGYACHNTTLDADNYRISGDYAGFAAAELERRHPGAAALFMQLCGADANPYPRGTMELAERHGRELAAVVGSVLAGKQRPVRAPLRAAFRIVEPRFAPYTRESLAARATDKNPAVARNARALLKAWDDGRPVRRIPYPVQAVRFGKDLTLVALGGEVVSGYSLRLKQELGGKEPVVVAGYSNDVMCYIPTLEVLKGGGYEAADSMVYYGLPGPLADDVEEVIFGGIRSVLKRVGR